jgi:hypothetical protein
MARLRNADEPQECLFIGEDRKSSADNKNGAFGTFPTRRDVRLESGMRVKPDVTASLWGCPLSEQLGAPGVNFT